MSLLSGLGRGVAAVTWAARAIARGWGALHHPRGWYDEIDEVYGTTHTADGKRAAGAAGLGGHISGGAG